MPVAIRETRRNKRVDGAPVRARGATLVVRKRGLLAGLTALALGMSAGAPQIVAAFGSTRTISLYHIHTKETLTITYKEDGRYVASALKKINWLMRDWRQNKQIEIDPKAIDLLWEMHTELGSKKPIHIICGYRSEKTNNMLRRTRGGQAKKSYHIRGKAIDAAFPDIPVKQLRYSALIRERGGVGYYPTSGIPFVHVDTGRVRAWPRLPRHELALLFPNGRTKHRPKRGGPITREDVRIARSRHKQAAAQVAAFFDLRNRPKTRVQVAEAKPSPALTAPPQPARRPELQVASLSPGLSPERAAEPKLEATPRLIRASTLPSANDRGKLDDLVKLASLSTPAAPAPQAPPPPNRSKLAELITAALKANGPAIGSQAFKRAKQETRVAALEQETAPATIDEMLNDADESWNSGWAPAPEFDEEHPEELSYRPFPVAPFLTQSASPDDSALVDLVHPDVARTLDLLDDRSIVLPLRLRPGRQVAEVMWAQQFSGGAVDMSVLRDSQRPRRVAPGLASHQVRTTSR
jgi:uncharacterized protein YcbK (DUF882 family)